MYKQDAVSISIFWGSYQFTSIGKIHVERGERSSNVEKRAAMLSRRALLTPSRISWGTSFRAHQIVRRPSQGEGSITNILPNLPPP